MYAFRVRKAWHKPERAKPNKQLQTDKAHMYKVISIRVVSTRLLYELS